MADWQPIDTAPKEGCIILGWRDDELELSLVGEGYWDAGYEGDPYQPSYSAGWCIPSLNYFNIKAPTHWQPLPSFPSTEREINLPGHAETMANLDALTISSTERRGSDAT